MYVYIYVCIYIYIRIHVYIHAYTYMYTHETIFELAAKCVVYNDYNAKFTFLLHV